EEYVTALRALLRGETVQWDGVAIRMLHTDGFLADRPVDVEVLIGADGPKGTAVAERVGDGVFAAGVPNPAAAGRPYSLLQFGTVLDDGEDVHSRDVMNRAGHGLAVVFHAFYERGGADAVLGLPGGRQWVDAIQAIPAAERHLVTHEGHLVRLTAGDEEAVALAAELLPQFTFTGTATQLRDRVAEYGAGGVTELVYQPAGPDVAVELGRMMDAVGDVTERGRCWRDTRAFSQKPAALTTRPSAIPTSGRCPNISHDSSPATAGMTANSIATAAAPKLLIART